jgi:hypothetical protein
MSGARGKSPLRGKWGGIKKQLGSEAFASPIDREQVSGQMQDIFSTVKKLRVSHPLRPSPRAQWLGAGKGDGGLRAGVAVVWHRSSQWLTLLSQSSGTLRTLAGAHSCPALS